MCLAAGGELRLQKLKLESENLELNRIFFNKNQVRSKFCILDFLTRKLKLLNFFFNLYPLTAADGFKLMVCFYNLKVKIIIFMSFLITILHKILSFHRFLYLSDQNSTRKRSKTIYNDPK